MLESPLPSGSSCIGQDGLGNKHWQCAKLVVLSRKFKRRAPAATVAAEEPIEQSAPSRRFEWAVAGLLILFLLGTFSTEVADTDFWWHLKTGEWIVENGSLPDPDPFSYTSELGTDSYEGESMVRRFNLTHEWLAQVVWYCVYAVGGFAGLSLWKGVLLSAMFAILGLLVYRDTGLPLVAVAAVLGGVPLATMFASDRPTLVTFAMVATFVLLLELHDAGVITKELWAIPALALVWANCHGGFFLGFVVLGAYSVGALRETQQLRTRVWTVTGCSVAAFALNPNGLRIVEVLQAYQNSAIQSTLIEWRQPPLWGEPPYSIGILLFATAAVMPMSWRRVRWAHWLLFVAFGAATVLAFRNAIFLAFFGPWFIAKYGWPGLKQWVPPRQLVLNSVAIGCVCAATGWGFSQESLFQLRGALWRFPVAAADLLAENVPGNLFNSYEYGGYLIWRLGPERKTFIDGRALNDSVYEDYRAILYSQRNARELLRVHDINIVVTNAFEYSTGVLYPIVETLRADSEWALVQQDAKSLLFARRTIDSAGWIAANEVAKSQVVEHLVNSCGGFIEHMPILPNCARTLGFHLAKAGDFVRAKEALELYFDNVIFADLEASRALDQIRRRLASDDPPA